MFAVEFSIISFTRQVFFCSQKRVSGKKKVRVAMVMAMAQKNAMKQILSFFLDTLLLLCLITFTLNSFTFTMNILAN